MPPPRNHYPATTTTANTSRRHCP
uniref:Uncharacterized protein n=1 Tax=Arundo donax TaxID=35708 RepID=A0A0A8YHK3_ARUDO